MAIVNQNDTYIHYSYILKEFFILLKDESIQLPQERIGSISIVNDYINNLFPIMSVDISIDASTYYKILRNKEDIKFKIRIQKFYTKNMDSVPADVYEDYLSKTFTLIMDDEEEDFDEELRKLQYGENEQNDLFATKYQIQFFLFDAVLMKTMKQTINQIFENGTVTGAIAYMASRVGIENLLMTRADNMTEYPQLIIPPMKLSHALTFIDTFYGIHENGSMIFFGHDRGYLLRYDGKCSAYEANEKKEISIVIPKTDSVIANNICQLKRQEQPSEVFMIADYKTMTFYDESVTQDILIGKEVRIIDVNSGEIEDTLDNDEDGRRRIILNSGYNKYFKKIYKSQVASTEAVITLTLQDIDLSMLTPNKKFKFIFEDITLSRKYKGNYILAKTEIMMVRGSNEYTVLVNCVFRKSIEE